MKKELLDRLSALAGEISEGNSDHDLQVLISGYHSLQDGLDEIASILGNGMQGKVHAMQTATDTHAKEVKQITLAVDEFHKAFRTLQKLARGLPGPAIMAGIKGDVEGSSWDD